MSRGSRERTSAADEAAALARAAEALVAGEVVAFPTESTYGLAVAALDHAAVARLVTLKGRPSEQTVPVVIDSVARLGQLVTAVPDPARALIAAHWPGPLTLVLPARPSLPAAVVGPFGVGVRVPSHPVARALVQAFGGPLTATSANPTGRPPARTPEEVLAYFDAAVHLLDAGPCPGGPPSTVVRFEGHEVVVIRAGAVVL